MDTLVKSIRELGSNDCGWLDDGYWEHLKSVVSLHSLTFEEMCSVAYLFHSAEYRLKVFILLLVPGRIRSFSAGSRFANSTLSDADVVRVLKNFFDRKQYYMLEFLRYVVCRPKLLESSARLYGAAECFKAPYIAKAVEVVSQFRLQVERYGSVHEIPEVAYVALPADHVTQPPVPIPGPASAPEDLPPPYVAFEGAPSAVIDHAHPRPAVDQSGVTPLEFRYIMPDPAPLAPKDVEDLDAHAELQFSLTVLDEFIDAMGPHGHYSPRCARARDGISTAIREIRTLRRKLREK